MQNAARPGAANQIREMNSFPGSYCLRKCEIEAEESLATDVDEADFHPHLNVDLDCKGSEITMPRNPQ